MEFLEKAARPLLRLDLPGQEVDVVPKVAENER